tara:strand:+ start:7023 stop:7253 length:231 start_codon:yes stop_codon:yes gene_type:complete
MDATKYEVINKETGLIYPVTVLSFGNEEVTVTTEVGDIVFANPDAQGQLTNEEYLIRQVGTHLEADGEGTIEIPEE